MKTFKWTVPEPTHASSDRELAAFEYWDRVRTHGFEWFVVSKASLFAALLPAALVGYFDFAMSTEMLVFSWLAGLGAAGIVWSQREKNHERRLEAGFQSRFESDD